MLHRLTGRRTVPNVILDFSSVGGSDEITLLHAEGGLKRQFEEMEVVPGRRRRRPTPEIVEPVLEKPAVPELPVQPIDLDTADDSVPQDTTEHLVEDHLKRAVPETHEGADANADIIAALQISGDSLGTLEVLATEQSGTEQVETTQKKIPAPEPLAIKEPPQPQSPRSEPDNKARLIRNALHDISPDEAIQKRIARRAQLVDTTSPQDVPPNTDRKTERPIRIVARSHDTTKYKQAPNPRQVEKNGIAALAAAARIHYVRS